MSIREAVEKSGESFTIFIVKEALFCKVYEESAWRFIELVKPYKPGKKRVKKLNMDVVSIGFPKSQLPAILDIVSQNGFTLMQEEQSSLTIKTLSEPDTNFAEWKQQIAMNLIEQPGLNNHFLVGNQIDFYSIVNEVELFSVADHTPMQGMQFLIDLQNRIKLVKKMPE